MKKIVFVSFMFLTIVITSVFSIETYNIEKGRFKSNNPKHVDIVSPYVWQPWQNMNSKLIFNEDDNNIITNFDVIKKYKYYKVENKVIKNVQAKIYYTKDNCIITFYDTEDGVYLHINDINNQLEMYYKIKKIN